MAEFQELAKAINDNSQCLVQTAQGMSEHNRTMIECTKQIVAEVGSLDLGEAENKEKSIGFGQLKVFDGNPKLYENWIKDIEKAAYLNHANDRKKQLLAYQFSTGLVSDYIKRYLESEEHKGWDHLKANLASRFSPVLDGPKAFELLVSLKQNKDEDIQFFAERLLGAAQRAYPQQNEHIRPITESQLLSIFLAGIWDKNIRAQVERSGPRTFDEAYALALREQQIFQRCASQRRQDGPAHNNVRGHESMEIDHNRSRFYNDRRRRLERHDRNPRHDKRDRHTDRRFNNRPNERGVVNQTNRISCWECNEEGHKRAECPKRLN